MIEIKTLIELFDECQIKNVVSALSFKPEKIVFVGFKNTMTEKRKSDIESFLKIKGIDAEIEYEVVGRYDFDEILKKLYLITELNDDCYFDLTGGKELVLAAMGVVSEEKDLPMVQFDVKNRKFVRVKKCEGIGEPEKICMSIAESVRLNGGTICNENANEAWNITEDFKNDVFNIWEICRRNCGLWNRQASVFGIFENFGEVSGLFVKADLNYIEKCRKDAFISKEIIKLLEENGLINNFSDEKGIISFRYKNEQVKRCLSKAGNILELYAYTAALEINQRDKGYYDDADIGICVDWDGIIYDETISDESETRNEIDVMIMRGGVPVFISCKNGEVRKEALYELDIVAKKFGGEYARKILLSTYVSSNSASQRYLLQRASDMNIEVIDRVHEMEREEFLACLKRETK